MTNLKERLLFAAQSHPSATALWPSSILQEAEARIAELERERDEARMALGKAQTTLIRIQNEGDAHSNACATAFFDWLAALNKGGEDAEG